MLTKEILAILTRKTSGTAKVRDWQENVVSDRKSKVYKINTVMVVLFKHQSKIRGNNREKLNISKKKLDHMRVLISQLPSEDKKIRCSNIW